MGASEAHAYRTLGSGAAWAEATQNQAVRWKFKGRARYRPYPAELMMVHIIPSAAVPEYFLIT